MRVHLDEIPITGLTLTMEDRPEVVCKAFESHAQKDFEFVAPLKVHLQLKKLGDNVIMTGHLATQVHMQCSRCLEGLDQAVATDFHVVYMTQFPERLTQPSKGDLVLTADDMGLMLFENDIIDPGQALFEEALAAIPQKPLCTDKCRGLCATCGKNLNTGQCTCGTHPPDPRWTALKNLKL